MLFRVSKAFFRFHCFAFSDFHLVLPLAVSPLSHFLMKNTGSFVLYCNGHNDIYIFKAHARLWCTRSISRELAVNLLQMYFFCFQCYKTIRIPGCRIHHTVIHRGSSSWVYGVSLFKAVELKKPAIFNSHEHLQLCPLWGFTSTHASLEGPPFGFTQGSQPTLSFRSTLWQMKFL